MLNKEILDNKIYLYLEVDLVANNIKDLVPETKELLSTNATFTEVILDIKNVTYIDSIGISFIIGLYKSSQNMERSFSVVNVNNDIKQLFELMKLNNLFKF